MTDRINTDEETTVEDRQDLESSAEETPIEGTLDERTAAELLGGGDVADDTTDDTPDEPVAIEEGEADLDADAAEVGAADAEATEEEPAADAEAAQEVETPEPAPDETEGSAEAVPPPQNPYDLPGDWYVIHSYSGYENKVKANMETRVRSLHLEERIYEVHIPMEDVVEFKGGKKVTVPKKVFPGYLLVRMRLDDESWYAVRNTPGVTGFVGNNNQKPTPLSRREVERFLGVQQEEEKGGPRFKPAWEVGEQVRVVTGPFADFNGIIEDINLDQSKVVVLVNIFGRDTPVELGFDDIQKN